MKFFRKLRFSLGIAIALLVIVAASATPALANSVTAAKVTDNCTQYTISLSARGLTVGKSYTITWQIQGLSSAVKAERAQGSSGAEPEVLIGSALAR